MNNATPGPWALDDYTDDSLILIYGEHGDNVAEIYHVSTGARSLANARLIAAAPDMAAEIERLKAERDELLEACKMLHKALLYCGSADVQLRLEQEALAKYDIVVYEPRFTK